MSALGLGSHNTSRLPRSFPLSSASRGSMVLYCLADEGKEKDGLLPPTTSRFVGLETSNHASIMSSSGSLLVDSKYPGGAIPSGDENEPMEEDLLHGPRAYGRTKLGV